METLGASHLRPNKLNQTGLYEIGGTRFRLECLNNGVVQPTGNTVASRGLGNSVRRTPGGIKTLKHTCDCRARDDVIKRDFSLRKLVIPDTIHDGICKKRKKHFFISLVRIIMVCCGTQEYFLYSSMVKLLHS